jgi:hypothetical protein
MSAHILITDRAYVLSLSQNGRYADLARLEGAAQCLLPAHLPLSEGLLEAAIEMAEDWLMPHATGLQGEVLEVTDTSGSLQAGLESVLSSNTRQWTLEEIEQIFLRVVDWVTGGAVPASLQAHRHFVAHVLLLREMAHHGRVSGVRLNQFESPTSSKNDAS